MAGKSGTISEAALFSVETSPNLRYKLNRRLWTALDWLLPPVCAGCAAPGARFCPACEDKTHRAGLDSCVLCGKHHPAGAEHCRRAAWLDQAAAWGVHQDPLRKAIHRLKYKGDLAQGDALAVYLLEVVRDAGIRAEIVLPVPLARQRGRERGFNQAALLARPLAYGLGLPYRPKALRRVRETDSQVGKSLGERRENVSGAFAARGRAVFGRRVLLVDDVLTTGATLDAAAEALKQAGAAAVAAVVVSRAA